MKRMCGALLLLLSFLPSASFAWGEKGHTLVAEVAFNYLNPETRKNVLAYLDGMTLSQAANWMDAIKSDPANDYMKPYHYIDIEKGSKEMPKEDNIISTLVKTLKDLDHKETMSNAEIKTHILFLMHLIGDLHQPLHVGYPGDKGGNDVKLSFYGRPSNLHAVWDSEIIETQNLTLAKVLKANLNKPKFDAAQKIDVIAWAGQTRSHLKEAYHIPQGKIDELYVDANAQVIDSQIYDAGVRLAVILEHYFGNKA